MKTLENIQKAIFEARRELIEDANIRKMLCNDLPSALSGPEYDQEVAKDHFTVSAFFDMTDQENYENTMISIALNRGTYDDELVMVNGLLRINILTRTELWELNNQKIRPLEIADRVILLLNNKKLSSSHKLAFSTIELIVVDEHINGYTLTFFLDEGSGLDEQF